jgi:hypothetical protein
MFYVHEVRNLLRASNFRTPARPAGFENFRLWSIGGSGGLLRMSRLPPRKQTPIGRVGMSAGRQLRTFLEAAVAASGQQANRVFGWTSCFSGASGGVECSCRRSGTCRNRRSGRTSSSGAIGRHTLLRGRPIFRFRSTIHHEVRAASAAARCVTSGEKR